MKKKVTYIIIGIIIILSTITLAYGRYIYNEIIHVYKMNNDDDDIISQLSLRYE